MSSGSQRIEFRVPCLSRYFHRLSYRNLVDKVIIIRALKMRKMIKNKSRMEVKHNLMLWRALQLRHLFRKRLVIPCLSLKFIQDSFTFKESINKALCLIKAASLMVKLMQSYQRKMIQYPSMSSVLPKKQLLTWFSNIFPKYSINLTTLQKRVAFTLKHKSSAV